jgi:protein involved in ribonucleotide reduction
VTDTIVRLDKARTAPNMKQQAADLRQNQSKSNLIVGSGNFNRKMTFCLAAGVVLARQKS